jgi:hypothetical protein
VDKNTHSDHVILTLFPKQRWLRENASLLRSMYIAWLVNTSLHCPYCFYYLHFFKCCTFKYFCFIISDTVVRWVYIQCRVGKWGFSPKGKNFGYILYERYSKFLA